MISERDLTDICFASSRHSIKENLKHYEFHNVDQLMQKAVSIESGLKESHDAYKSHRQGVHFSDDNSALMMIIKNF